MISRRDMLRLMGLGGFSALMDLSKLSPDVSKMKANIMSIFIDDMGWPALSCYPLERT
jgi:hypothetical protein